MGIGHASFWSSGALGLGAMGLMLALVCGLTVVDPVARSHKGLAGAIAGAWCAFAPVGLLRSAITGDPLALSAWAAAAVYLLAIIGSLGRPLLIASGLVERRHGYQVLSNSEYRRGRAGQIFLIVGIAGLAALSV
ncbi:hypothetical protein GCM10009804_15360 [Kribbella hippodromi]|uniref:Uncharacterized protein n=1 Tax=Kribbella hippodromi TaxID=434347 RepID=A0ABN2CK52_9ACTN